MQAENDMFITTASKLCIIQGTQTPYKDKNTYRGRGRPRPR